MTSTSEYSNGKIEISVPSGNDPNQTKFASKSLAYSDLSAGMSTSIQSSIATTFKLKNGSANIDVNSVRQTVYNLSAGNMEISGIKEFKNWPFIKTSFPSESEMASYGGDAKYIIPNIDKVNALIGN